ncbi:histidine kinase, partial [Bartonella sp. TT110JLCBS]|uniref:histidine kinase n=1 Tax=Bartonella sp. TT110JLCBS TaxID=3243578 RepID=UPI0035D110A1
AIAIISYAAYIGIGRRFNQAEELRQANIKLNQANNKIAKLTSQRVRQEVARDLHDTLTQDIVGINMQLAVIKMLAEKQDYDKMKMMLDKTEK